MFPCSLTCTIYLASKHVTQTTKRKNATFNNKPDSPDLHETRPKLQVIVFLRFIAVIRSLNIYNPVLKQDNVLMQSNHCISWQKWLPMISPTAWTDHRSVARPTHAPLRKLNILCLIQQNSTNSLKHALNSICMFWVDLWVWSRCGGGEGAID